MLVVSSFYAGLLSIHGEVNVKRRGVSDKETRLVG